MGQWPNDDMGRGAPRGQALLFPCEAHVRPCSAQWLLYLSFFIYANSKLVRRQRLHQSPPFNYVYVLSLAFSHVLALFPALVIFTNFEDDNPKTDWAAAATRAGNRVLAENQECRDSGSGKIL